MRGLKAPVGAGSAGKLRDRIRAGLKALGGAGNVAGEERAGLTLDEPRFRAPGPAATERFLLFAPLMLLGMFGAASCFSTVFHIDVDVRAMSLAIAGLSVGVTAIFISKYARVLLIALGGALAALCLLLWEGLRELILRGAVYTVNTVILTYGGSANIDFLPLPVAEAAEEDARAATTLFALAVLLALALLLGWLLIRKRSALFSFVLTFPFLAVGLAYTLIPHAAALTLIGLFWCFLLLCVAPLRAKDRFAARPARRGAVRRIYVSGGGSALRVTALSLIPIVALCLLVTALAFPEGTYKRPRVVSELRSDIINGRIGFALFRGGGVAGRTNRVDLRHVGSPRYKNETALRVKSTKTSSDYLKGFVGSVYTETGWEQLPDTYTQQLTLLTDETAPQNYAATLYRLFGLGDDAQDLPARLRGSSYELTVENVKMNPRCIYAPYGLSSTPGALAGVEFVSDAFLRSSDGVFGTERYTLDAVSSPLFNVYYGFPDWEEGEYWQEFWKWLSPELRAFFEEQSRYAEFARERYTALPEDVRATMEAYLAEHGLDPARSAGDDVADFVLELIWQVQSENEYTLSPGLTPEDRDFIEYFLYENHRGYCVHFATAVTVLLRAADIPARYVEGFVVSPDDPRDEGGWVNIADDRAHAWVEVYVNGAGWLPVEATPSRESGVTVPMQAGALGIPLAQAPVPDLPDRQDSGALSGAAVDIPGGGVAAVASSGAAEAADEGGGAAGSGGGSEGGGAFPAAYRDALIIAAVVAAAAVLAVLAARALRRRRLAGRERAFADADRAKAVLAVYASIDRLLCFAEGRGTFLAKWGGGRGDRAGEERAQRREPVLPEGLMATVMEARFGGRAPSEEALAELRSYANELSERAQKDAGALRRLLGKYVYGLF
jgi:hypothetical protein